MSEEIMRAIGKLEGKLDAVYETSKSNSTKLDTMDGRLRSVENKSAVYGSIGGTVAGVGVSLLVASLKDKIGMS